MHQVRCNDTIYQILLEKIVSNSVAILAEGEEDLVVDQNDELDVEVI